MGVYDNAKSFVGTKRDMECWSDRKFLADVAAMKFNLTDKQRLRLREEVTKKSC